MKGVWSTCVAGPLLLLVAGAGLARAEDISGPIVVTRTIFEDSQLVGDVTCATVLSPCIQFGASHIKLRLNGFTMTGRAQPDSPFGPLTCSIIQPANEDGIRIADQTHAQVLGPGIVQRFRRHGVFVSGTAAISTNITIRHITSNHNCFSGIFASAMSDSVIEDSVSIRNSSNSGPSPCGGSSLDNSHNNRIRRNQFSGNGAAGPPSNDCGIGLLGNSSNNVIEDNSVGGNINGVLVQANTADNVIRRNVIVGNPPGMISRTFGPAIGFDVRDESVVPGSGARNTFERNWCVTYLGPGPAPCPNLPGPGRTDNK